MGVDVELYATGQISDEQIAAAESFISARSLTKPYEDTYLTRRGDRVEFNTLSRYYGPGYERGSWPIIYADILLMQAAFPGCTIHYGGDSSDEHPAVDLEMLAALWQHFLGPNGTAYFDRR